MNLLMLSIAVLLGAASAFFGVTLFELIRILISSSRRRSFFEEYRRGGPRAAVRKYLAAA